LKFLLHPDLLELSQLLACKDTVYIHENQRHKEKVNFKKKKIAKLRQHMIGTTDRKHTYKGCTCVLSLFCGIG
jgi:hypothetical protein